MKLVLAAAIALSQLAHGCVCFPESPREVVRETPVIAAAEIVNVKKLAKRSDLFSEVAITARVFEALKGGTNSKIITFYAEWETGCSIKMKPGERWILYLDRFPKEARFPFLLRMCAKTERATPESLARVRNLVKP